MADPLAWLKLGGRSRTPSAPLPTSSPDCKAAREHQLGDLRRPASSRMSSHIITQPETGLEPLSTDDIDDSATTLFVRNQDRIWYNPSLDQMVEALQVLLMTRGVLEPIPLEYNSYILHLIEGFAKAQASIRKAEAAHQDLKQLLEQNIQQFRLVADSWLERESEYRAEVKRLEVLLAKSSRDGLEAVTLARATSVIDRNGAKRRGFLSRLNEFKRDLDGSAPPPVPMTPKILDNDNDFLISEKFRKQDAIRASMAASRERRADPQDAANRNFTITSSRWQDPLTKASTAVPGERPTFWRGEALDSGLEGTNSGQGGFPDPLAAPTNRGHHHPVEAESPIKARATGDVVASPSSPVTCYLQGNNSGTPATTTEPGMSLTAGAAFRHERGHSGFSFEPGDDRVSLLDNPAEEQGESDTGSCRQAQPCPSYPAHSTQESVAAEECRRRVNVNSWVSGLLSGKDRKPTKGDGMVQSPAGKPARGSRDSGGSKRATIKIPSSQSSHGHDSPVTASNGGQEASEKQQTETEARITATLALANAPGGINQKK